MPYLCPDCHTRLRIWDPDTLIARCDGCGRQYPYEQIRNFPSARDQKAHTLTRRHEVNNVTLWEGAIIEMPTQKDAEDGVEPKLVLPVTAVLAQTEAGAIAQIGKVFGKNNGEINGRMKVLVRPFV